MASLADIRSKYPEYGYLSDRELADAMHQKFYPDMDRGEFDKRVGITPEHAAPQRTLGEAATGLAKTAGAGLVRGAVGFSTLPGNMEALGRAGINAAAGLVGAGPVVNPDTALINYNDFMGRLENKVGPLYKPQTTAEDYVNTIAEFIPGALAGGTGGLIQRGTQAAVPAIASETAGQFTEGTAYEPAARIAGAIAGTRLPNVGARVVTPAPADPARNAAVQRLQNEGVTALTAGQRTGNTRLRWIEDSTATVPGGGGHATAMQTQAAEQYTRAALRRAGINAPRATQEVMDDAFRAIGAEFDQFAAGVTVKGSPMFGQRLARLADQYENNVPPVMQVPAVRKAANDIAAKVASPQGMTGTEYATYRSELRRLQRGMKQNPQGSEAVGRMIENLDAQMVRSAPKGQGPDYAGRLQSLNRRYRNMLAIEDAAGRSAGEGAALGLISPAALKGAVKLQNKKDYTRGRSELGQLAKAGESVMRPLPSSGTAERSFAQGVVSAPGSVVGYAVGGDPLSAALGMIVPAAARAGSARAVMSTPVQNYFANQRIPQTVEAIDPRMLSPLWPFMATRED